MSEKSIIEWVKLDNNIKLLNQQLKNNRQKNIIMSMAIIGLLKKLYICPIILC